MSTNGEKVTAIKEAWKKASETAVVDLDLMAQVAINVLVDWHKRDGLDTIYDGPMEDTTNQAGM